MDILLSEWINDKIRGKTKPFQSIVSSGNIVFFMEFICYNLKFDVQIRNTWIRFFCRLLKISVYVLYKRSISVYFSHGFLTEKKCTQTNHHTTSRWICKIFFRGCFVLNSSFFRFVENSLPKCFCSHIRIFFLINQNY